MSQRIEIVAGDDVVGQTIQDIFKSLSAPGILEGFNLTVALNGKQVRVSPGVGLLDSGAFIFEDEIIETAELPLGGGPRDFTVLYRYVPTNTLGGSPAVLVVEEGLYNPDTFVGGLILGWIKHSGSATLDQKDFIPGRRVKLNVLKEKRKDEFLTSFAPLSSKWAEIPPGATIQLTEGWNTTYKAIVTSLANVTNSIQSTVYHFPLLVPSTGLGQILVECEVPNTANLIVSFLDTAYTEYAPSSWVFIASPMSRKILAVPQSLTLQSGQMAFIKLSMNFQPGSQIRFKTLGFSSYTEPF